jgi:hypothetical protein
MTSSSRRTTLAHRCLWVSVPGTSIDRGLIVIDVRGSHDFLPGTDTTKGSGSRSSYFGSHVPRERLALPYCSQARGKTLKAVTRLGHVLRLVKFRAPPCPVTTLLSGSGMPRFHLGLSRIKSRLATTGTRWVRFPLFDLFLVCA